ncbi:MAG: hypothetical protein KME30_08515 [Iphinoe sp. HA4291-MV1]|nr:hypothetical protein [Iphinoe sp. HA4291-MV1]
MNLSVRPSPFALRPRGDARGERAASPLGEGATPEALAQACPQDLQSSVSLRRSEGHIETIRL